MRALIISVGGCLATGFALLGVLVGTMGEGQIPVRRGSAAIDGLAVYPMAIAWVALAIVILCISLLMAEVGPKYYIRIVRNWAFFAFAVGFIASLAIAIHKAYGPVAL
jgi:hypothetical protein